MRDDGSDTTAPASATRLCSRQSRAVVGARRSPPLGGGISRRPGGVEVPPLPPRSLPPPRYEAWESQPRQIRSQFLPVPTERSYQDRTCRMEYFKLYQSPDQGRLIAAPSQGRGGGAAARWARPQTPGRSRRTPPHRTPTPPHQLAGQDPAAPGPRRGGPGGRRRSDHGAWHRARGEGRGRRPRGRSVGAGGKGRAKSHSRLICRGLLCFLLDMSPAPRAFPEAASSP